VWAQPLVPDALDLAEVQPFVERPGGKVPVDLLDDVAGGDKRTRPR